jgi:hypothetical protein
MDVIVDRVMGKKARRYTSKNTETRHGTAGARLWGGIEACSKDHHVQVFNGSLTGGLR